MFVLALLITVSSAIFGHISAQASSAHTPAVATSVVIVQPGQTMWGLAAQVAPNDDPRDTIERIAQLNSLTGAQSSTVYPGQRLVVPATA
jgi:predicted Zn-dependent protease